MFRQRAVKAPGQGPVLHGGTRMAEGPPSSAYAWNPRAPTSQAWQFGALPALVLGPLLACQCAALPPSAVGIQLSRPGSPPILEPVTFGTCHRSAGPRAPGGSPGLCVWTVSHTSHGAATAGIPTTRAPSLTAQRPLGLQGPRVHRCSTEAWLEAVGLSRFPGSD